MKMTLQDARKLYIKAASDYVAEQATFEQGQAAYVRVIRLREIDLAAAIKEANSD
jgi:hypothetical protein